MKNPEISNTNCTHRELLSLCWGLTLLFFFCLVYSTYQNNKSSFFLLDKISLSQWHTITWPKLAKSLEIYFIIDAFTIKSLLTAAQRNKACYGRWISRTSVLCILHTNATSIPFSITRWLHIKTYFKYISLWLLNI